MRRTPIIPIRLMPEYHDTDRDGVPNYRDCNPWNPHEHEKRYCDICKRRTDHIDINGKSECQVCGNIRGVSGLSKVKAAGKWLWQTTPVKEPPPSKWGLMGKYMKSYRAGALSGVESVKRKYNITDKMLDDMAMELYNNLFWDCKEMQRAKVIDTLRKIQKGLR